MPSSLTARELIIASGVEHLEVLNPSYLHTVV